jgi:hypothetical protein
MFPPISRSRWCGRRFSPRRRPSPRSGRATEENELPGGAGSFRRPPGGCAAGLMPARVPARVGTLVLRCSVASTIG